MQGLTLFLGILAALGGIIAFLPCLGALNWLVVPVASLGVIFGVIAVSTGEQGRKGAGTAGLILSIIAVLAGIFRLVIGGGVV